MVGLVWLRGVATLSLVGDHFTALALVAPQLAGPALIVLDAPVREATLLPAPKFRVRTLPGLFGGARLLAPLEVLCQFFLRFLLPSPNVDLHCQGVLL